ncbi:hypothetical protein [Nocardia australiensis]|uniref:hypothetical protein n=1 Tax=Nocardia australiensis TaxID=2887191 RepID=UPI001D159BD3|nr:hypothetical protein [Nocardia australiensis]
MTSRGSNGPARSGERSHELSLRAIVERREKLDDSGEKFEADKATATSDEERQRLASEFSKERETYRKEEVAAGRRPEGTGVIGRQAMWAAWIDVAVRHAVEAKIAIASGPTSAALAEEFHASLIAVTASAYAIEAVYLELKYLIPCQKLDLNGNRLEQFQIVRNAFAVAFGLDNLARDRLGSSLAPVFKRRNSAVHPSSEMRPLAAHPSGVQTSPELAEFNAKTSKEAVECALGVLTIATDPENASQGWVARWVRKNAESQRAHIDALRPLVC